MIKVKKKEFHKILKKMCNRHDKTFYQKYKKWCDNYFYLTHRKESRGIGGVFFDYQKKNFEKEFKFVQDVGDFSVYFSTDYKKR